MRKARYIIPAVIVVVVVVFLLSRAGGRDSNDGISGSFPVERGTITEKAVAIGTIGPRQEIEVKSKDEIGALAESICRMQDSVRLSVERLRRRR